MDDRGQAFTLEAITASLLLVGALVFALQVTAVTPLSASTSSQHIENQQEVAAEGALANAVDSGTLRVAVLNWNASGGRFYGASDIYFVDRAPTNEFGDVLARTFTSRNIVYNVNVYYQTGGQWKRQRMVYRGQPSNNAVSSSVMVTLSDDDALYDDDQTPVTVTGESHTYNSTTQTNALNEGPVVRSSVGQIVDNSGDVHVRKENFTVADGDGDGKPDTINWTIGGAPDDGETFTIDYTPAISDDRFYAADRYSGSSVYTVVKVEVVAWRQ